MVGIDVVKGEYIVIMDGDFQNDLFDLFKMFQMVEEQELDMVAGECVKCQDGVFLWKIFSWIVNYIICIFFGVYLCDYGCVIWVMRVEIVKDLGFYGELYCFILVLVSLEMSCIKQIFVKYYVWQFGVSKYGLGCIFKVVSDLLFMLFFKCYMVRFMYFFGNLGIIMLMLGILINFYLFGLKLFGNDIWGKFLMILGLILLLGGIQFIIIGIIVEIQMRIYYELQDKWLYWVWEIL